jgi:hypothetical protein
MLNSIKFNFLVKYFVRISVGCTDSWQSRLVSIIQNTHSSHCGCKQGGLMWIMKYS